MDCARVRWPSRRAQQLGRPPPVATRRRSGDTAKGFWMALVPAIEVAATGNCSVSGQWSTLRHTHQSWARLGDSGPSARAQSGLAPRQDAQRRIRSVGARSQASLGLREVAPWSEVFPSDLSVAPTPLVLSLTAVEIKIPCQLGICS
ncbi:MAG: hypothetical protein ACI835_003647 [Planctomycetota bacterium]|jgi:hypothetical protein